MELISREEVLTLARTVYKDGGIPTQIVEVHDIKMLPTIENKPKSKWNHHKTKSNKNWYECDSCGWVHFQKSNYCPNCGADMRDEEIGNNNVFLMGKGETKPKPYYITGEYACDRNKCHENEINDVPCAECECCADMRVEEQQRKENKMDHIDKACKQIEQMLREGRSQIVIRQLRWDGTHEVSITEVQNISHDIFRQESDEE